MMLPFRPEGRTARIEHGPGYSSGWLFRPPIRRTTTETVHLNAGFAAAWKPDLDT